MRTWRAPRRDDPAETRRDVMLWLDGDLGDVNRPGFKADRERMTRLIRRVAADETAPRELRARCRRAVVWMDNAHD